MTSTPLNYMPPAEGGYRRWLWWAAAVVAGLLFLFFVLPTVTARQDEMRIDPITGSMNYRTIWWLGIVSGERTDVSPLESRLKSSGIAWTRSWQHLTTIDYTLFSCVRACSPAPPIYAIRSSLKDFADASTDRELQDLVRVMQSGTQPAQIAAIDAAFDKAVQASSAR